MNDDKYVIMQRINVLLGTTVGFGGVPWLLLALTQSKPLYAVAVVFATLLIFAAALVFTFYLVAFWESFHFSDRFWPVTLVLFIAPFIAAKELVASHDELRYALVMIGEFDD